MKPWLLIISVNILSFLMLMAIAFGILTGIGTACKLEVFFFFKKGQNK
jgi:hypothetical protein